MTVILDPTSQFKCNYIRSVQKAYGDVPAAYSTLIALGSDHVFKRFVLINSLNQEITIQFNSTDTDAEIPFPANQNIVFDDFPFYGTLNYKYTSAAPTSGSLQIICY